MHKRRVARIGRCHVYERIRAKVDRMRMLRVENRTTESRGECTFRTSSKRGRASQKRTKTSKHRVAATSFGVARHIRAYEEISVVQFHETLRLALSQSNTGHRLDRTLNVLLRYFERDYISIKDSWEIHEIRYFLRNIEISIYRALNHTL